MFTIIIGEEGEYGRRLNKYLETHWRGALRLHSFTKPETLLAAEEPADCWILGEPFVQALQEAGRMTRDFRQRCIRLSGEEGGDAFCRYHSPAELLHRIEELQKNPAAASGGTVTGLYSPVFDPQLARLAASRMKPGDLYLGMEDLGGTQAGEKNMGDLCYYIGLRSEEITEHVRETAREEDGMWFVDSPQLYFDLLELSQEEYQWFFRRLKECRDYGDIYVGLGSGILSGLPLRGTFDHLVILDSRSHERRHLACGRIRQALESGAFRFDGSCESVYREDLLHEDIQ